MGTNNEWSLVKLDDIVNIISSKRIFAKDYVEQGIPFYRSKEIIEKSSGNEISNKLFITVEKFEEIASKYGYPKEGDILLTSVGTLGVPYLVKDEQFYFKDGNLTWFKDFSKLNNKFLFYWFYSPEAKSQIQSHQIGSTQKALTISNLKSFNINLPTETIQSKIVSILSSLDRKIEVNNKIIDNLEQQAQTIFKSWFIDFEPFQDSEFVDSELGPIPKGFGVKKVKEICEIKIGRTPSRKQSEWFSNKSGIKWVSIKDMGNSKIFISETSEYLTSEAIKKFNIPMVEKGTLLLSFKLTVGRISIAQDTMTTNEAIANFSKTIVNSYYLYYVFKNLNFNSLGNTSSIGNAVNSSIIKDISILVPNQELLEKFIFIITPIMEMISNLIFQNQKLAATRDLLLPKLLSGELDVSDFDI